MEKTKVELDVRKDLANGLEPFPKIIEAVASLGPDDVFILHTPFQPVPLYGVLGAKGFEYTEQKVDNKHWIITFAKK
ncbi:DUF2249 domain-containing protein [Mesobacillus harenae]|uniref:DUF2249 domain-containing protein n=1 Tax=Mesobacillus harenae TaxID=2213203 RepID=UPI0015800287|nr:DUF2249 domain-containing protein [Mesobacillus harenae]